MFEQELNLVLSELKEMLLDKNQAYGNSVFNPVKIFSKDYPYTTAILARIDDKLSRIANRQGDISDNDLEDLVGYLILLMIDRNNQFCPVESHNDVK